MGLPISKISCCTNANDLVNRCFNHGDITIEISVPTVSPAMDIRWPYNLERIFYFIYNTNCNFVKRVMTSIEKKGTYQMNKIELYRLQQYTRATSVSDKNTVNAMQII
eukprot:UN16578